MKPKLLTVHAAALCLAALGSPYAVAQDILRPVPVPEPRQGLSISLENDLLGAKGSDRWFTNGLHVAGSFKRKQEPALAAPVLALGRYLLTDSACTLESTDPACHVTLTFGGGQNMYTPRSIDIATPQLRDRPWAGWLYGSVGVSHYRGNRHQMWSLKVGPTGPAALARQAQSLIHRHISHSPEPLGWGNQLRPMLGVQLSYLSTYRYMLLDTIGLQVSYGGVLGNTRTLARAGLGLSWSPADGEARRLQPGTLDEGEFLVPDFNSVAVGDSVWQALRHVVLYAHVQGSAVAYNAFLQGRAYGGRAQIEPLRGVATTTLGFTVPLGKNGKHKLGLAFKRRSPEFSVRGETNADFYQRWGVLTYSLDFDVGEPRPETGEPS